MTDTDKLAALLRAYRLRELFGGKAEYNDNNLARWLTERGVVVRNNSVACVNCKEPVNVTALNAVRCAKCAIEPSEAALRDRDELWCKALIAELNVDDMNRVLGCFQKIRSDRAQFTQETGGTR